MKNNEIMISARFEFDDKSKCQELSFLVLKDITLKAFIEALYYGLKNPRIMRNVSSCLSNISKPEKNFRCCIRQKAAIM